MRTVPPRSTIALLAAVVAALVAAIAPAAASAAEGDIIVKYASGADAQDRAEARADAGVVRDQALPLRATEVVTPQGGTTVREAVADLEASPDVAFAEPDRVRHAFDTYPSEAQFDGAGRLARGAAFTNLWGLSNQSQPIGAIVGTTAADIHAPAAWDLQTGSSSIKVAVVDSGVDRTHPDLFANLVPGWDFAYDDPDPTDYNDHGTHVAGIIAARGNNGVGVTGVAWQTSIEPLQALDATGSGSVSDIIAAYDYAGRTGAQIVNASLGGDTPSPLEREAIQRNRSVLFVVAAGNHGASDDNPATASYPCAYDLPNVLCVGASDNQDHLASWSNYGAASVDIAAPGVDIYSTVRCGGYDWMSGTSMATPEVSGAAALLLAQNPSLTPAQVRAKLMSTADPLPLPADAARIGSGGRLDVAKALGATFTAAPPPDAATSGSGSGSSSAMPTKTVMTTREGEPQPPAQTCPAAPARSTTGTGATAPATPATPVPATPAPAAPVATPAPATTPVRATTPAADRTAPTVSAALARRGALRRLLSGKLRVSTSASERASVRVELRVDRRTAKRLHLATGSSTVAVATGSATLTKAGSKAVTVRLSSKAKRALKRLRSLKATLRATATDAAQNRRTRSSALTITR